MRIVMRFVHHHMRACLPNVSHWANETHPRHGAGFYYGVPWRAATRINVFCRDEACFVQFPRAIYSYKRKRKYIIL